MCEGNWTALWLATQESLGKATAALRLIRRVRKTAESDHQLRHVCLPAPTELGSHWTDTNEILYLMLLRKSVEKIQDSLKSDKNNGDFTCIPMHMFMIKSH